MATQFSAADFGMAPSGAPSAEPVASGPWGAADFASPPPKPLEGPAQDTIWSSLKTAGGKVLDAVGYGAQQGWGAEPLGLSPETEQSLRDRGIFNDYQSGHVSYLKAASEGVIRGAAQIGDLVSRTLQLRPVTSAVSAAAAGLGTTGEEIQGTQEQIHGGHPGVVRQVLGWPFSAAGEILGATMEGFMPEFGMLPHGAPDIDLPRTAATARSVGVVGEGEAGAYDAAPLTPKNVQARAAAAQEAGIEPEPAVPAPQPGVSEAATPAVPTVDEVARRIDPETFNQYDALTAERDTLREQIESHQDERAASPEAEAARADIADLLGVEHEEPVEATIGRDTAFRASAPPDQIARLDAAYDRLDAVLARDTPEQAALRDRLTGVNLAMRDITPQMAEAMRNATDIMPDADEAAPTAEAAREAEKPDDQARKEAGKPKEAAGPQQTPAPVAAGSEAQAEVAPANVLGDETLGEGVKPAIARGFAADTRDEPQPQEGGGYTGGELRSGDEFDIADSISPDGPVPERVRVIKEGNGGTAIVTSDGHVIDLTGDLERGVPIEEAIARHLGHDTSGKNVKAAAEPATKPRYTNALRPTEGTGELATRGLSKGVEARAIEEGLASRFGDLPEYHRLSMADQAAKALDLIDKDYEGAKAIALGDKQPPKGILPETMYVAVEKHALAAGDVETLQQLATRSRLTTAATTMGQRIRTLGERDQASPVGAIQDVAAARAADLAKRGVDIGKATRETLDEARAEVRKAASGVDKFAEFLKSIECG